MKIVSLYALLGSVAALTMKVQTKSSVNKVLDLLNDMQESLAAETEEAEKANAKFECWCNKVDALQQEIEAADGKIHHAVSQIQEFSAAAAEAETEIKDLQKAIKENQESQNQLTADRNKEATEFHTNEVNLVDSITALKNALEILAKHQSFAEVKSALRGVPVMSDKISALLQGAGSTTDDYESQSGGVFGILQQMETEFTQNLDDLRQDEANAVAAQNELMAAKKAEFTTLIESLATSKSTLAHATETVTEATRLKEGQAALLASNTEALNDGKAACKQEAEVYAAEAQDRGEEAKALGEAIRLLSSDDMFAAKTAANSFAQTGMRLINKRRLAAIQTLRAAGTPKAFMLSTKVGNEAMDMIFKAGQEMVVGLKDTMTKDTQAKDGCVAAIAESDLRIQKADQEIQSLSADKEACESSIAQAQKENDETTVQMNDFITQLNDKAQARTDENGVFQKTVADQKTFQKEINKAKQVLEGFYAKKGKAEALVQQDPTVDLEAMPETKRYEKKAGNSIMIILDDVVAKAKQEVELATKGEADTQATYEEWVKGTNGSINSCKSDIAYSQESEAGQTKALVEVERNLDSVTTAKEEYAVADGERKESCKFIQENYGLRQEKMQSEIDSINDALSQLQGQPI